MKSPAYLVVANREKARFFKIEKRGEILEHESLVNPESHQKRADYVSDRPGRSHARVGANRHAYDEKLDPREKELAQFAKKVAGQIEQARITGQMSALYLFAEPHLLGLLRQELLEPCKKLLAGEKSKDIAHLTESAICKEFETDFCF